MKTVYLVLSNDYVSINIIIDNILKKNGVTRDCLIKYDLFETSIIDVINDLDTYNFLLPKKVIVCDNCYFLNSIKPKGVVEQNVDVLQQYLKNPSDENILILVNDCIDERKSIVKLLRTHATIVEEEVQIDKVIKAHLDGCQMNENVIRYLIDYCGNDHEKIMNELEKLKNYKYDEKVIACTDIDEIVLKSFNDNVFSLIDAIMNRNRKKAITLYEDLLKNGEDTNKILTLLQDQFRMIYNGKILLKDYHNNYKEVASILGIHPYRFQKAMESSYNYSKRDIINNLSKLDDIEIGIKTGKTSICAIENFIYSL